MLQGENRLFTATRLSGQDVNERWHELRRQGVGGSDVAAIMGLSPWRSPLEVWLEKTGRRNPDDLSGREAVAMGVELEDTVMEMYRRRHPERRPSKANAVLRSKSRPWAQASLDGVTHDPKLGCGVLELKTGSRDSEWADGVPLHYVAQVVHYMTVTGYRFADVAALIGDHGLHYHEYRVMWDDEDAEAVVSAVDSFWTSYVEADAMPPAVTALESEGRALWETYAHSDGEMSPDDAVEAERLADELMRLNDAASETKAARTECSNRLKRLIGERKGIVTPYHTITWVRSEKRDSGVRVRSR